MATNKSATEQLDEFKAAALLSVWRERLLDIDKKAKRITELEEENRELNNSLERLRQQRNDYRKDLDAAKGLLDVKTKQLEYASDMEKHWHRKFDEACEDNSRMLKDRRKAEARALEMENKTKFLASIINTAPENIYNYFVKRIKQDGKQYRK